MIESEQPQPRHPVLTTEKLEEISDIFKTMGHPNRLKIWIYLCHTTRAVSVSTICNTVGLSTQLVSHHLKDLKLRGIVGSRSSPPFELYYPKRAAFDLILPLMQSMTDSVKSRLVEDM